ncbi:MAG: ClpX C4-type zinc finger protein [Acidimicrobiales bacterium]
MLDNEALERVLRSRTKMFERRQDLEAAEASFHHAIRVLHATGGSLQEIADAIGISRQRVHQIVKGSGGIPGRRRRRTADAMLTCSFCDLEQGDVAKLIAGPGVYICDRCIAAAVDRLAPRDQDVRCSFCGKHGGQVPALMDRDGGIPRICSECLALCNEIIEEELGSP